MLSLNSASLKFFRQRGQGFRVSPSSNFGGSGNFALLPRIVDAPARRGEGISASTVGTVYLESKSDGRVSDSVEVTTGILFALKSGRDCF